MTRRHSNTVPNRGMGNESIAIIGDGETEKWFFQLLKDVENIKTPMQYPEAKGSLDVVLSIVQDVMSRGFTKVYWLVDFDVIVKEERERKKGTPSVIAKFFEAKTKLEHQYVNKLVILINNPCLEYWYLLHYKETSKYYEKYDELKPELCKYLANYEKNEKYYKGGKENLYQKLVPMLNIAQSRAEKLTSLDKDDYQKGKADIYKVITDLRPLLKS